MVFFCSDCYSKEVLRQLYVYNYIYSDLLHFGVIRWPMPLSGPYSIVGHCIMIYRVEAQRAKPIAVGLIKDITDKV